MAATRARILTSAIAAALAVISPSPVVAARPIPGAAPAHHTTPVHAAVPAHAAGRQAPPPPQLPANFQGKGRYIVRDLGIDVPFTWEGRDGDSQMVAGGPGYPIWFTNL